MKRAIRFWALWGALTACGMIAGCLGSTSDGSKTHGNGNGSSSAAVEFPDGDPSVSPELGGPGFTGDGWTTTKSGPLGDPAAVRGGAMLSNIPNWPENLRIFGTGSNTYLNSIVEGLCYESLCGMNPDTREFVPSLATHWKISDDKMKFEFRINPKAHWSDGKPVTSADVIATYRLIMDETLVDPMNREAMSKFKEPVAKSKYLLEVECRQKDWRNFITFSGTRILPSHEIGTITGKDYLEKYNFRYTATSGPYIVYPADIKDNESITITRRKDYWGDSEPINGGLNNFEKIRFVVIRDDRLAFDKACKGELDFYAVYTAKWWVEDLSGLEAIKKGHLLRQKIYTRHPAGFQGEAFNMRKPPLDDVRVRKALGHLFDRKSMVEKFAYNEYDLLKSYFPGSDAENKSNQLVAFDPREASRLLAEAGWKDRGGDGILVKDGKRLSLTISYNTKGLEKYFTSWKEDARKAGVELNLSLLNPETQWTNTQERKFEIGSQAWTGSVFPDPKSSYHSMMADANGSNNITGLKNAPLDKLIEQYDEEFDLAKRTELLRQIDGLIFNDHPYAMAWYLPCERILYWNKFGMPSTVLHKYEDWRGVFNSWWIDPSKDQRLKDARKSGEAIAPVPPVEVRPWNGDVEKTAQR